MCRLIGFSAEYVEKMTPVERGLFWVYYKEELKEREKNKTTSANNDIM